MADEHSLTQRIGQGLKDYVRSVYANKWTLSGYLTIPVVIGAAMVVNEPEIAQTLERIGGNLGEDLKIFCWYLPLMYSVCSIFASGLGMPTKENYEKAKARIEKTGTVDKEFINIYQRKQYCGRVGMEMAVKEAGLEDILDEHKVFKLPC